MKHYSLIGLAIYFSSWVGVAVLGLIYCNWHEVASTVVLMPLISLVIGTAIVLFMKFVLKKERRLSTFYRSRIQKPIWRAVFWLLPFPALTPLIVDILHGHPQTNDTLGLKILALLGIIMMGEVLALDVTEEIAEGKSGEPCPVKPGDFSSP
ncbi:hypothetical protein [Acetobacter orleanensis]|uniref:Uncharacterized protein n=1 Tax=Acetobacter orleanensis TaxID=104099 RepID=A0A4Y3TSS2_9PROT|nr:hypothetical protein [Acetobacter orleanensis]KXV66416.1 hypothetical protein AD949_02635 [Acetobacter orleanensis]PCD78736.1 hypothetical protein CO710_10360 [Acetobacter orleanensis]GAN67919.1 hypothetical protein Abol_013_009 [Acetobacter orleanensis JCM 7639]GBR29444.1 hypothetical protein AA0473_2014 [Acetobacter orleanensis NRIC 0473]GEB83805.1 hypothetical protein AOR01nite_22820 [Acetobacter orleanensis]